MGKMGTELKSVYDELMEKFKDLTLLGSMQSLAHWDMETKMPPEGVQLRSEQLALLRRLRHKMITDPEIGKLLASIREHPDYEQLSEVEKRNVYLIRKNYKEETKLPERLVSELAKHTAIATKTWKEAKAAADFSIFQPKLEKLLELKREEAKILMKVKDTATPYDALIDKYEPRMTTETIAELFSELKNGLQSLIDKCASTPNPPDPSLLQKRVPISAQRQLANSLANFLEYDVASEEAGGRIDETEHPFTTGYYDDVRITTNYHEADFTASFFSVLHEGGHAIHGRNQKRDWMFQPVGSSASAGFSESQARFVENIVGRSKAFWRHFFPKFQDITNGTFSEIDLDTFFRAINVVQPSKIRIKADEVTYCLHIVIRFEIERKLLAGDIAVTELPTVWNRKYEDYLGVRIEDDAEGVLQDTHWASGLYGYFPSYALGNIYSGQLLDSMEKDLPEWRTSLVNGDFHPIKNWLKQNVYQYGALYDPEELISKITGEALTVQDYLKYLQNKYSQLYDF